MDVTTLGVGVYGGSTTNYVSKMSSSKDNTLSAINSMDLVGGTRRMGYALDAAVNMYEPQGNNRKVYVMFTTGNNQITDMPSFSNVAQTISAGGNELFIVALGNSVDISQFVDVIVPSRNIYNALNINALPDWIHNLLILNMPSSGLCLIISLKRVAFIELIDC